MWQRSSGTTKVKEKTWTIIQLHKLSPAVQHWLWNFCSLCHVHYQEHFINSQLTVCLPTPSWEAAYLFSCTNSPGSLRPWKMLHHIETSVLAFLHWWFGMAAPWSLKVTLMGGWLKIVIWNGKTIITVDKNEYRCF